MEQETGKRILCFGEIVWDALPEGLFLGGAPLNVAYHLHRLGHEAAPVSRVGRDFLGRETLRRLRNYGVDTSLIQEDAEAETGAVIVQLDASGDADYTILEHVAWDRIAADEGLAAEAGRAEALVYGSLSARASENRRTLDWLLREVNLRICDVNLRKPYDDVDTVLEWASRADVIKLNAEELDRLCGIEATESLEQKAAALAERSGVGSLVVTRGGDGAALWEDGHLLVGEAPAVEVADTVGAGDAFTAGYLDARLRGLGAEACLERALALGGLVAGRRGAQPEYDPQSLSSR